MSPGVSGGHPHGRVWEGGRREAIVSRDRSLPVPIFTTQEKKMSQSRSHSSDGNVSPPSGRNGGISTVPQYRFAENQSGGCLEISSSGRWFSLFSLHPTKKLIALQADLIADFTVVRPRSWRSGSCLHPCVKRPECNVGLLTDRMDILKNDSFTAIFLQVSMQAFETPGFSRLDFQGKNIALARCLEDARAFCKLFINWYNQEHYHSGIACLTPETVHYGKADDCLRKRGEILATAFQEHPERFPKGLPVHAILPKAVWINPPEKPPEGDAH
ncbi:MAG: hypothetical protein WA705_22760 [Candidatus Ozemobacteraceae bacterium]